MMLYHSFACSRISYEITAWGTAAEKYLKEIETKLNIIVRTITWNKKLLRVTQLNKNLKLLKLRDVYNLELAKLKEIETKLNIIVRTITWNKKFSRVTQLYKNLKLLKLRDVYNLELAKFMNQIYNY